MAKAGLLTIFSPNASGEALNTKKFISMYIRVPGKLGKGYLDV